MPLLFSLLSVIAVYRRYMSLMPVVAVCQCCLLLQFVFAVSCCKVSLYIVALRRCWIALLAVFYLFSLLAVFYLCGCVLSLSLSLSLGFMSLLPVIAVCCFFSFPCYLKSIACLFWTETGFIAAFDDAADKLTKPCVELGSPPIFFVFPHPRRRPPGEPKFPSHRRVSSSSSKISRRTYRRTFAWGSLTVFKLSSAKYACPIITNWQMKVTGVVAVVVFGSSSCVHVEVVAVASN